MRPAYPESGGASEDAASVGPPVLRGDAVAAFRPVGADRDHLETVVAALERAYRARRDANDVPLPQLDDLVVELDATGTADHDVDLFLLAMAVAHRGAEAGAVPEVADSEMLGVEMPAREMRLQPRRVLAGRVVDLLQVCDREVRHR